MMSRLIGMIVIVFSLAFASTLVLASQASAKASADSPATASAGKHIALAKAAYKKAVGPAKKKLNKVIDQLIQEERTKIGRLHTVPLSAQTVAILKELQEITGDGELLFPGLRSKERPISDNSLNAALRRLGYAQNEMTAHGFRTMASTRLHELGFESGDIELQLGHLDRNQIRAAYNRAERLAERRQMMQAWADYLDGLRADKESRVTSLRRGAG